LRKTLEERIERIQRKIRLEIQEEPFIGGTRIVWGEGGEIMMLLQEDEFITLTIKCAKYISNQFI